MSVRSHLQRMRNLGSVGSAGWMLLMPVTVYEYIGMENQNNIWIFAEGGYIWNLVISDCIALDMKF